MSFIIELLTKYILQPLAEKFLKPFAIWLKEKKFTWKDYLAVSFLLLIFLGILNFNRFIILCKLPHDKKVVLTGNTEEKLDTCINILERDLTGYCRVFQLNKKDIQNSEIFAWTATQLLLSLENKDNSYEIDTSLYLKFIWEEYTPPGWREFDSTSIHIAASAWTLYGLALLNKAIPDSIITFFCNRQFSNGAWPMYEVDDEKFGSTYATCYMLLALDKIRSMPFLTNSVKDMVNASIIRGEKWLQSTQDKNTFLWKDYPHLQTQDVQFSVHLSSIAVVILNKLNVPNIGNTNKEFYGALELNENDLLQVETSNIYYPKHNKDNTQYMHIWEVAAMTYIYNDLDYLQKFRVSNWTNEMINHLDADKMLKLPDFERAELLTVLKYLK